MIITMKDDQGGFVIQGYYDQIFFLIFIKIFLIFNSLEKLMFLQLECKEFTIRFSLLSCTVGYALPS